MIDANVLAGIATEEAGKKYLYKDMDCQAFVEHCMKLAGKRIQYRGSNDMIREFAINVRPVDDEIKPGCLVFMVRHDGKEPIRYGRGGAGYRLQFEGWNAHHIGIYVGNG